MQALLEQCYDMDNDLEPLLEIYKITKADESYEKNSQCYRDLLSRFLAD